MSRSTGVVQQSPSLLSFVVAKVSVLVLELQDHGDTGEVQTSREQVTDAAEPVEVVGAVPAGATGRSLGFYEAAGLIKAQVLGRHSDELGGDGDAVDAAVAMHVRSGGSVQISSCLPLAMLPRVLYKIYRAHHRSSRATCGPPWSITVDMEVIMMLMRSDPFRELDRLTQQVFGTQGTLARPAVMPMDAWREGDTFVIELDVPGVRADSIDLDVERNVVTVRAERPGADEEKEMLAAERPRGVFSRQLILGDTLDTDNITAAYDSGVLTLKIPVAEKSKPRKITIGNSTADTHVIQHHQSDERQAVNT